MSCPLCGLRLPEGKMGFCGRCAEEVTSVDRIGRQEPCPACHRDLHVCLSCEFYDPRAYNECHETSAERVLDKETANFCDYFSLRKTRPETVVKTGTRGKLDRLFKK